MSAASTATSVPRRHGDADVRLCQRGRIVDAVADHRHDVTVALESANLLQLAGGQHARDDVGDAQRMGHRLGGAGLVAREQDWPHAQCSDPRNRFGGLGTQRVGEGDGADGYPIDADVDERVLSGGASDGSGRGAAGVVDPAHTHANPVHDCLGARTRFGPEPRAARRWQARHGGRRR